MRIRAAFEAAKTDGERKALVERIKTALDDGDIKMEELSIRDIAEATLGRVGLDALSKNDGAALADLREAVSPVMLSNFTNITGVLVLRAGYEAYTSAEFVAGQLQTEETDNEDNVRVAGLADIDDDATVIPEGQEYPTVKFGEDYIAVPSSVKRGARLALTKEMIFFDKTGRLLELARQVGYIVGRNKEIRSLRNILGVDNTFSRKGVSRNTYVSTADPRINKIASNALQDYSDIEAVEQLFANYTDDRTTGEPITVNPDTMLVSPYKEWTARRLLDATQVRIATNTAATQTYSPNPLGSISKKLVVSPWVKWVLVNKGSISDANAKEYWYYGNFKKAFRYRTLFPFAMVQAAANSQDDFERDVVAQWKASERGVPYTWAPWFVAQSIEA